MIPTWALWLIVGILGCVVGVLCLVLRRIEQTTETTAKRLDEWMPRIKRACVERDSVDMNLRLAIQRIGKLEAGEKQIRHAYAMGFDHVHERHEQLKREHNALSELTMRACMSLEGEVNAHNEDIDTLKRCVLSKGGDA